MNWNWKRTTTILLATALLVCMPVMALAAEDDIVDEAEVYLETYAAEPETYIGMNAVTIEGTAVTGNLDNSPAVRGDGTATTPAASETEDEDTADATTAETTNDGVTPIPDTGAASMLLPIGTALLSLGTIAAVARKKK